MEEGDDDEFFHIVGRPPANVAGPSGAGAEGEDEGHMDGGEAQEHARGDRETAEGVSFLPPALRVFAKRLLVRMAKAAHGRPPPEVPGHQKEEVVVVEKRNLGGSQEVSQSRYARLDVVAGDKILVGADERKKFTVRGYTALRFATRPGRETDNAILEEPSGNIVWANKVLRRSIHTDTDPSPGQAGGRFLWDEDECRRTPRHLLDTTKAFAYSVPAFQDGSPASLVLEAFFCRFPDPDDLNPDVPSLRLALTFAFTKMLGDGYELRSPLGQSLQRWQSSLDAMGLKGVYQSSAAQIVQQHTQR